MKRPDFSKTPARAALPLLALFLIAGAPRPALPSLDAEAQCQALQARLQVRLPSDISRASRNLQAAGGGRDGAAHCAQFAQADLIPPARALAQTRGAVSPRQHRARIAG